MAKVEKKTKVSSKKTKADNKNLSIKKDEKKSRFELWEVIVVMIITALFGLFIGSFWVYKRYNNEYIRCSEVDSNVGSITTVYNEILYDYYGDIDKNKLADYAIEGMIEGLDDPYADYIDGDDAASMSEELSGTYIGLGVVISNQDNNIKVVSVSDDSPASKAGILPGDLIMSLNSKKYTYENVKEFLSIIKESKAGDKFQIDVIRNKKNIRVNVVLDVIELSSVYGSIVEKDDKKVGVISITSFANNTYEQFVNRYNDLLNEKIETLVIDLRNNGGGYISSASSIASLFLEKNDVIYKKTDGKTTEDVINSYDKSIDLPVVLLVNGYTASSSEVFASSLKDNVDVTIVGTKTYGKGTIQKVQTLGKNKYIKYTVQEWLTAKGSKVDGIGITPDVIIPYDDMLNYDVQYNKAIEIAVDKIGG